MKPLSQQEKVGILSRHPFDADRGPTMAREQVVAIVREHLELEEVEAFDTDDEIWRLWKEEAAAGAAEQLNATVLRRVLERIEVGD